MRRHFRHTAGGSIYRNASLAALLQQRAAVPGRVFSRFPAVACKWVGRMMHGGYLAGCMDAGGPPCSPEEDLHLGVHVRIVAPQVLVVEQLHVQDAFVLGHKLLVHALQEQACRLRATERVVRVDTCIRTQQKRHTTQIRGGHAVRETPGVPKTESVLHNLPVAVSPLAQLPCAFWLPQQLEGLCQLRPRRHSLLGMGMIRAPAYMA